QARDRLTAGIFLGNDEKDPVARLEEAFESVIIADESNKKIKQEAKKRGLKDLSIEEAVSKGVISTVEMETIAKAEKLTWEIITVDDFSPEELSGNWAVEPMRALSE